LKIISSKGVDLYTIQKLGRWKTLSMVMKCAHLSPKHQQNAVSALEGLFENKGYKQRGDLKLSAINRT
jgi:hypothetical protein